VKFAVKKNLFKVSIKIIDRTKATIQHLLEEPFHKTNTLKHFIIQVRYILFRVRRVLLTV